MQLSTVQNRTVGCMLVQPRVHDLLHASAIVVIGKHARGVAWLLHRPMPDYPLSCVLYAYRDATCNRWGSRTPRASPRVRPSSRRCSLIARRRTLLCLRLRIGFYLMAGSP